ncbi:MAG: hypothetical protein EOO42_08495, partial [Flavobacteriales bacterium]
LITISGTVNTDLRGKLTLKVWQEEKLFSESEINLTGQTQINLSAKIKAGEYNYFVKVYFNGNEIKNADRVVAGDIYVFYGQSNALGYSGINEYRPLRNVFLRYYVMYNFENKDGEWLVPFETSQWPGTGLFPLELERMLYEKHKYPIGVVVGAVGGADIATLGSRNAANPTDVHTDYGKLLTQVIASGPKEQIKYLIFRHGETDATFYGNSETYPHQLKVPLENTYGMIFYSRLPLRNGSINFLVKEDIPSIETEVQLKSGQWVKLYCLHPEPPVPQENPRSTERDKEILIVAEKAKDSELPLIVMGDLNDVAWSYTTELFGKVSGLLDPRRGRGFFNSFNAKYFFLRFPLDHIFCSTNFALSGIKRMESCGSDHFPMCVNLQLDPPAEKLNEKPVADQEDLALAEEKINAATDGVDQ